jgi:hypothetical protein
MSQPLPFSPLSYCCKAGLFSGYLISSSRLSNPGAKVQTASSSDNTAATVALAFGRTEQMEISKHAISGADSPL